MMESPTVETRARDEANNVTYIVVAYRKLSDEEMVREVQAYLAQPMIRRRRKPERNLTIRIVKVKGYEE